MKRNDIQKSIRLYGKGTLIIATVHTAIMDELRNVAKLYNIENIYNEDESGLFFRMV